MALSSPLQSSQLKPERAQLGGARSIRKGSQPNHTLPDDCNTVPIVRPDDVVKTPGSHVSASRVVLAFFRVCLIGQLLQLGIVLWARVHLQAGAGQDGHAWRRCLLQPDACENAVLMHIDQEDGSLCACPSVDGRRARPGLPEHIQPAVVLLPRQVLENAMYSEPGQVIVHQREGHTWKGGPVQIHQVLAAGGRLGLRADTQLAGPDPGPAPLLQLRRPTFSLGIPPGRIAGHEDQVLHAEGCKAGGCMSHGRPWLRQAVLGQPCESCIAGVQAELATARPSGHGQAQRPGALQLPVRHRQQLPGEGVPDSRIVQAPGRVLILYERVVEVVRGVQLPQGHEQARGGPLYPSGLVVLEHMGACQGLQPDRGIPSRSCKDREAPGFL